MKELVDQEKLQAYLKQYELEQIFSEEVKKKLTLYTFHAGETLCSKGDQLSHMLFLVQGKVKIFTISPEGKTFIIRFKTPLGLIGDIEYVKGMTVFNTVEAVSDGAVISVSFDDLRAMQANDVAFLQFLLEGITQKFYSESHATSFNMLYPVEVRLASYLLSLSSDGEGSMFHKEMHASNLTEIADLLGTSYRHLNRVINKLCAEGMIARQRGVLTITDLEKLRDKADGNIYE